MTRPASPVAPLVVPLLVAALALSACSGDDGGDDGGDDRGDDRGAASSAPASATAGQSGGSGESEEGDASSAAGGPKPYLPVPDGVVLTDQGSELGVGESAVVAFRPRQGEVGVLKMTVRKLEHADIKALKDWRLDPAGRRSSLYYVKVTVRNDGDTDLGGRAIPLYVLSAADTLVEPNTFRTTFEPCPSPALPETFEPGDKTSTCLVYLLPRRGELEAATFRPTEDFNPITWVGPVKDLTETKKPKKKDDQD